MPLPHIQVLRSQLGRPPPPSISVSHLLLRKSSPRPLHLRLRFYSVSMAAANPLRKELPRWSAPPKADGGRPLPPLSIYNTFTRKKEPFVPLDKTGKRATWYCCGPTVYDASHLGHARNYVTTDILRRILRDYFGFDVVFVQNVTDVDDKIILRARHNFLLKEFKEKNPNITPEVIVTTEKAWKAYVQDKLTLEAVSPVEFEAWGTKTYDKLTKLLAKEAAQKAKPDPAEPEEEVLLDEKSTKTKMELNTALLAARALSAAKPPSAEEFYTATSSVLQDYLDATNKGREYGQDVFSAHSQYWEQHFNDDMATLNVLPPTVVTRVSEFIPENVAFIEKIVSKGFAYPTSDGSVYFDIEAYEAAGHSYAKLQPWNAGNEGLIADGEGALSAEKGGEEGSERDETGILKTKKSKHDFALWKAWRAGEPGWTSPWGKGRPGWHIECSVMCSEVLGGEIDIHSGGIDLAFPHHDNEIAQSEAYWDGCSTWPTADGKHQWINYFLHMGHLQIHGSKMSKSLKNFVSVRDALARGGWTSRSLRIVFLMGSWKDGIEVREGVLAEAKNWETVVTNFFTNVKALVAEESSAGRLVPQPWTPLEADLAKDLDKARSALDAALCDSFNTSAAMQVLLDLISAVNVYASKTNSLHVVKECARWITRVVTVFGLNANADAIGWSTSADGSAPNAEEAATPFIRLLSSFRDCVRAHAIAHPTSDSKALLSLCDSLRDKELPELGVLLDDREAADGKPALIKFVDAAMVRSQRDEKDRKAREKEEKKSEARRKKEEDDRRKAEQAKIDPRTMFKGDEWSEWDDDGVPTKGKEGVEVTKSKRKTLVKAWEKQKKLFEASRK